MANKRDYYEILGLSKGASDDEIKKAFRKMALKYHPDRNQGDKAAEESFKEVNEAYSILSDPEKKKRYDQFGHAGVDPNAGFGGGGFEGFGGFGGFEDIFSSFGFGGNGGFSGFGGFGAQRRGPSPGRDIKQTITIDFDEAFHGVEKTIAITKLTECEHCHGHGNEPGTEKETCPNCHGTGVINRVQQTPFGAFQTQTTCPECNGTGTIIKEKCSECGGQGRVQKRVTIKVNIPAGVDNGNIITLRGQGEAGQQGAPAGNLYIETRVRPHSILKRNGDDLYIDVPITFDQAALGDEIQVPTVDEKLSYKVPAGTQPESIFRMRGKGMPNPHSGRRGNLYVKVKLEVPKNLNDKQREAIASLGSILDEEAYSGKKSFTDKLKEWFS